MTFKDLEKRVSLETV